MMVAFHGLRWPRVHEEGSLVAIFRFLVSSLPVIRCLKVFRMVFVQNRRLSFLSHCLVIKRSQNWPDLSSPISKFWDIHLIDTVTLINRWKFQGNHSVGEAWQLFKHFFWGEVIWHDPVTWPWVTSADRRCFSDICEKPHEVSKHPRSGAG